MLKDITEPESALELRSSGNSVVELRTTVVEERVRRFRLGKREQRILGEIHYGHTVPVHVIKKLYFPGHTSCRIKRMGLVRRRGLVDIETYAVRERGRKNPRIIGKLYRLTEFGIQVYEKLLGKEPRQSRVRISQARPG